MAPIKMRGKNYVLFVGGIIGFIGLACYPIIIAPMMNPEEYSEYFRIF